VRSHLPPSQVAQCGRFQPVYPLINRQQLQYNNPGVLEPFNFGFWIADFGFELMEFADSMIEIT
jgi:hypothetical protein